VLYDEIGACVIGAYFWDVDVVNVDNDVVVDEVACTDAAEVIADVTEEREF
jgi:hypothetical protein